MGRLTTHVLDTAHGKPGVGIAVTVYRLDGERREVARTVTNHDGRCDAPLLEGAALEAGKYEIVFAAGDYFRALGLDLPEPPFVDEVALRFGIANVDQHYHVPLLVSPWSYSTYRGS
ncbi:5-hydroxyisourate hydrolase [Thauera sp. GDN1]|uniref:hydroxyisourate hydrolase n=1 Tax=Thauera sp. GDN1 TaxID=2944810 RepID=UPI00247A57A3|nr:hydroxyisourate hydrolase [Thauera sp. GDN1]WEN43171.1 5-hydroxyisourate hydrolase [Thauera sp. GDN1]